MFNLYRSKVVFFQVHEHSLHLKEAVSKIFNNFPKHQGKLQVERVSKPVRPPLKYFSDHDCIIICWN